VARRPAEAPVEIRSNLPRCKQRDWREMFGLSHFRHGCDTV